MNYIERIARLYRETTGMGGTLYFAGNGGCASICEHIVGELMGRFKVERPPIRAFSMTQPSAVITAIGNDYGFDQVFARQAQALTPKDCLTLLSTSGRSPNLLNCLPAKCPSVFVCGEGGPSSLAATVYWRMDGFDTATIQENMLGRFHEICGALDG